MDKATVKSHLEQAREHVDLGQRHIARQREIIAELRLREESQIMHLAHRDRLEAEWAAFMPDA